MTDSKWPKILPELTKEQEVINNDFVKHWLDVFAKNSRYKATLKFNHNYPVSYAPQKFTRTLEVGAGLGEHIAYEVLTNEQKQNYYALELREDIAKSLKQRQPEIQVLVGDCQTPQSFSDDYFDRILAIHVLEHLPNLPATIKEMYRLCDKRNGYFSVVIPCEGGLAYSLAREVSAKRIFEKRYKQSYDWFIKREHINKPDEILHELRKYFYIQHKSFFPFKIPSIHLNLCIGLTLRPNV